MKTKITLLFFALTYTFTSYAYTTLRVQDPQQTWHTYTGVIDTAVLSIKPKGAYFECGLYLTFSSRPHTNVYDTFEVQLFFDLPEGSIMHDSWLWVENQIIQAKIIDRVKATLTYEGIVQRRRDPSILYKNSPTQYELRVFPQPANKTRKVKLTWLVPAKWGATSVQCPIPMNILKASYYTPYFQILSYADSVWKNPRISEYPQITFQPSAGNPFTVATIHPSYITGISDLTLSMSSPMQNGVFAGRYETSPTDGYYQVVVLPSQALSVNTGKKQALLFDYEPGLSNTTPIDVLAKAKQMLHNYFSPRDSFNLIFSQLNIYRASNTWLPADSATIENTFNTLAGGNPISNYSNLPSLIANGVDFLKSNGQIGELVLISNSDNQATPAIANQLITDIQALVSPYRFPVNVVDYTEMNYDYTYVNNVLYAGNEYFYKNLSALTIGNYERMFINSRTTYASYNIRPFSTAMNELFETLDGKITNFEVHPTSQNGFCYGKYNSIANGIVPVNKPFIQIGKYFGSAPEQVEITGVYNTPFSNIVSISNAIDADELTGKMWVGNYIQTLEDANPDNQTIGDIMDISIDNRVLSLYTAFLALEPSDTNHACTDCEDETGSVTGIDDVTQDSVLLAAMPNPFNGEVKIQIHLSASVKESSLQIYNVMGQVVKIISMDPDSGNDFTFTWNGEDDKGEEVSSGIYLVVLSTPDTRHTLKLIKS